MPNTEQSVKEATDLVNQLVQKTLEKKISWVRFDFDDDHDESVDAFETKIPGGFRFDVYSIESNSGSSYGFRMVEAEGVELLRVVLESAPRWGYSLIGEEKLASSLARLHDLARRDSFKIDKKVDEAQRVLLAL